MKRICRLRACLMALTLPAAVATAAVGQEGAAAEHREAMMKGMQERVRAATTLGKHHEALGYFIGDWTVDIGLVMPGAPRQSSKGKARYEWLIDGRWVSQRVTGELMGAPYEGFTILGFDTYAKNHIAVSVSSMDTAMNLVRGLVVDPEGQLTALYGTLDEYTTGELAKPYKVVTRIVDDDHHTLEVWDLGIGDAGAKVLEFAYTRHKP